MTLKGIFKFAVVAAVLFAGVQYAKVYVHRTQIKKVMGDEALDIRRANSQNPEGLIASIKERISRDIPALELNDFDITGLGDKSADIVVTVNYLEVVDLLVYRHPMPMQVVARADAPTGND